MDIEELNQAMGSAFPTEGFETFGGFIYDLAGKVPSSGEKLRWPVDQPAWEFVVETVRQRRIITVRVKRLSRTAPNRRPRAADGEIDFGKGT